MLRFVLVCLGLAGVIAIPAFVLLEDEGWAGPLRIAFWILTAATVMTLPMAAGEPETAR